MFLPLLPLAQIPKRGTAFIPQINLWVFCLRFYKKPVTLIGHLKERIIMNHWVIQNLIFLRICCQIKLLLFTMLSEIMFKRI